MDNNVVKTKKSTAKKIWDVISTILIVLYIIIVLFVAISIFSSKMTGYPSILGHSLLFVQTDSMEGDAPDAIFEDDLVICKEQNDLYLDLEIGQIIAYREMQQNYDAETGAPVGEPYEIVKIHRIVGFDGDFFVTKGDNVEENDPISVSPVKVLGVYTGTRIPKIGAIFDFVQSQMGIMICMVVPMAIFFIWALYKFIKAMIEFKMEKSTVGAPAEGELSEEQKQAAIAEYLAKQAAEANKDENNTDNTSEE
ncbi:MAG: hypothetical protein IJA55_01000 [Clostridia bacterium]|nr:hypothetical protein [Clostridia bacterium]